MIIKDNVPASHKEAMTAIVGDEIAPYLQGFNVINGRNNLISRIMFRSGGLKDFLRDCRDPNHSLFIADDVEATLCCGKLSLALLEAMAGWNATRNKSIPHGSRCWVGTSLGIYFTIGCQDLESFFERGKAMANVRTLMIADGGDHQYGGS